MNCEMTNKAKIKQKRNKSTQEESTNNTSHGHSRQSYYYFYFLFFLFPGKNEGGKKLRKVERGLLSLLLLLSQFIER